MKGLTHSIRRQALLWLVAAIVLAVDQITKAVIVRNLPLGMPWNPIPFLRPIINITHVANTGAAFGMLQDRGTFFALVAIAVSAAILYYGRLIPEHQRWLSLSLGLQLGGALGNLADRLHYGHVIDFIEVRYWPVFNVADTAIVAGGLILAYYLWREEGSTQDEESAAQRIDPAAAPVSSPTTEHNGT
jgi:signal peptidase II